MTWLRNRPLGTNVSDKNKIYLVEKTRFCQLILCIRILNELEILKAQHQILLYNNAQLFTFILSIF